MLWGGILIAISMCTSCRTKEYITIEHVKTDTLYKSSIIHDSVFRQDSTTLYVKGDTVFRDRWQTTHVFHFNVDTVFRTRRDSIPYTIYIEKRVSVTPRWAWWSLILLFILIAITIKKYFAMNK